MTERRRELICPGAWACGLTVLSLAAADLTVRGLGRILDAAGEAQFGAIFSQIGDARLTLPVWLPLVVFALWGCLLWAVRRPAPADGAGRPARRALRIAAVSLLGGVVFLAVTAGVIWLTRVNGVRVGDVALSLLDYFRNGIADQL